MNLPLGIGDSWIQHAIKLVRNSKYRYKQRKIIVSGVKIISELSKSTSVYSIGMTPEILTQKKHQLYSNPTNSNIFKDVIIKSLTSDVMRVITREANPEGIIAEIASSQFFNETDPINLGEKVLILFKISDPGNLGTLIRTARAFNWNRIILVDNCVNPYNSECIRSSMGTVLKVQIHLILKEKLFKFLKDNRISAYIADSKKCFLTAKIGTEILFDDNDSTGLILGSESHGFTGFPDDLYQNIPKIRIEMKNDIDSLNVAVSGSILMNIISTNRKEGIPFIM